MIEVIVTIGLLLGGAVVAIGALHWRGLARFGSRGPGWGLGTVGLGVLQVLAWSAFPSGPETWARLLIALGGAGLVAAWLVWRTRR